MTYAFNNLFNEILNDTPVVFRDVYHNQGNYSLNTTQDGRKELIVNVAGHNPKLQYFDVTDRALWLLNQYGIKYTQKEQLGIMMADGLYNEATKKYWVSYDEHFQLKTNLPLIIHWADHMSTAIEGSEYKKAMGITDDYSVNF